MLSSLGQFRLAVKQLLPGAEESCPHKKTAGELWISFSTPVLPIRKSQWPCFKNSKESLGLYEIPLFTVILHIFYN